MPAIHHIAAVTVAVQTVVVDVEIADRQIIRLHVHHRPHGRVHDVYVLQINLVAQRGPNGNRTRGLDAGGEIIPAISIDRAAAGDGHIGGTLRIEQRPLAVARLAVAQWRRLRRIIRRRAAAQQGRGRINEQRHVVFQNNRAGQKRAVVKPDKTVDRTSIDC